MEAAPEPLLPFSTPTQGSLPPPPPPKARMSFKSPSWLALAAASGACAAFNGVFAKLTTTELTSSWSAAISILLGLSASNKFIEFLVRGSCFLLNLLFNGFMWTLFTLALTRASSTTRVSIINTSSNFMLTALLGWIIFGESLPGMWWLGAAGLVVGNVIIGRSRKGEDEKGGGRQSGDNDSAEREGIGGGGGGGGGVEVGGRGGGGISDGVELGVKDGRGVERFRDEVEEEEEEEGREEEEQEGEEEEEEQIEEGSDRRSRKK